MRAFSAAILALTLSISGAVAASQDGALAPGKPAGVKQANMEGPSILIIGGIAIAAAGIALAVSGGNNNSITPATAVSTSTSTSTTG